MANWPQEQLGCFSSCSTWTIYIGKPWRMFWDSDQFGIGSICSSGCKQFNGYMIWLLFGISVSFATECVLHWQGLKGGGVGGRGQQEVDDKCQRQSVVKSSISHRYFNAESCERVAPSSMMSTAQASNCFLDICCLHKWSLHMCVIAVWGDPNNKKIKITPKYVYTNHLFELWVGGKGGSDSLISDGEHSSTPK